MANKTPNYGLTKPLPEEFYDVGVHNENMDKIDTELKKKYDPDNKPTAEAIGAVPQIATYYSATSAKSADDLTDSFALIPVSADVNPDLFNIVGGTFAYVHTSFYISAEVTSRRMQIATTYNSVNPKMAMRIYGAYGWLPWRELANADNVVPTTRTVNNKPLSSDINLIASDVGAASNENLADNWYLADPVNSRGKTEYNFTNEYTIDRWKGLNKGVLTIGSEGVTLASVLTYSGYIRQFASSELVKMLAGNTITFSALVKGHGRAHINDKYSVYQRIDEWDIITVTYSIPTDITNVFFGFDTPNDDGASILQIKAVKLEFGSTPTIARKDANGKWILNDPPPDKGMELLKCIQSTADTSDAYANKVIYHTGHKPTPDDVGAVNKSGDTMTGNLFVDKAGNPAVRLNDTTKGTQAAFLNENNETWLSNTNVAGDTSNYRAIVIQNSARASNAAHGLVFYDKANNVTNSHYILHTGNKHLTVTSSKVTLTTGGWTLASDGRYYQTVSVASVTADSTVFVDIDLSTTDTDAKITYMEQWSLIAANEVTQGSGSLTFYAWEVPTANVPVNVGVV